MAKFHATIAHDSGIPLGGIGTGTVEIRPDGYIHDWQIFNLGLWAPWQPECCSATTAPQMDSGDLSFFIRTCAGGGEPLMRRLGLRSDQQDLYSLSWLKPVESIDFDGRFPVARLAYNDGRLPVAVESAFYSPLVPHDARTSGTPGFYADFTVRNPGRQPVEVSLLAALRNGLAWSEPDRRLHNSLSHDADTTFLTMRTAARSAQPTIGSMCLSVAGGQTSWVLAEYGNFLAAFGGVWPRNVAYTGSTRDSVLHRFRESGRLPSLPGWRDPLGVLNVKAEEIESLPPARRKALIGKMLEYPFAHNVRLRLKEAGAPGGAEGEVLLLQEIRRVLDYSAWWRKSSPNWSCGALASSLTLAPMEEAKVSFILSWHFPYHYSRKGNVLGHQYENWFADAEGANRFLAGRRGDIGGKVFAFADALYDTTLGEEFPDAWAGQLSTMNKCTWWTKDGDFAVWEGLGCCGFHTTDITYQGSFNILALWPELQKRQMEMGARFQRADGRVHHFFRPDFSEVDNGFDRVDMNPQFVLLACRDWLWTGDRAYLRRLWRHVLRAMDNSAMLDADGDGLPDHDTRRNTYDNWSFQGTPSYIASLWLAALLAGARLADDLGQVAHARRWRRILRKAAASFDRKLWNGEYYSLWVDGKLRDECCMTDQLDGEWFTRLVGLGGALPDRRVEAALRAVFRHNFRTEDGLINAGYPPKRKPRLAAHRNVQAGAPWTGIEYAIASMMLDVGMTAEGGAVVRNVHERYARAGRFWKHIECGEHYYRAMSSWALLLAASGFKIDVPRGELTVAPMVRRGPFRAPFFGSAAWGIVEQDDGRFALTCRDGELALRTLRLRTAFAPQAAKLNGRAAAARVRREGEHAVLSFSRTVTLRAGDVLTVQ